MYGWDDPRMPTLSGMLEEDLPLPRSGPFVNEWDWRNGKT